MFGLDWETQLIKRPTLRTLISAMISIFGSLLRAHDYSRGWRFPSHTRSINIIQGRDYDMSLKYVEMYSVSAADVAAWAPISAAVVDS